MPQVTTTISDELYEALEKYSEKNDRSKSYLLRKGLEFVLEDIKDGKIDGKNSRRRKRKYTRKETKTNKC